MKKMFIIMSVTIIFFCYVAISYAISFPDVTDDAWYANYVNELSDKKVINGYPDGTFKPSGKVTVGEFLKLIITASVDNINYELVDADYDHWAGKYLKVAENYGVIAKKEYSENDLNREATRIEVVRILSRTDLLIRDGIQTSSLKDFSDVDGISNSDRTYLSHAVGIGVINGDPAGTFRPNDNLTRAECAKIIYTYSNM